VLQIHFLWNCRIYNMMAYWGSSNKLHCLYLRTKSLFTDFSYKRSQKFLRQVYFHSKLAISFLEKSAFATSLSTPLLTSLIPSTNTYFYALYLFFIKFIDYLKLSIEYRIWATYLCDKFVLLYMLINYPMDIPTTYSALLSSFSILIVEDGANLLLRY